LFFMVAASCRLDSVIHCLSLNKLNRLDCVAQNINNSKSMNK
jgi:hypothetical protein